MSYASQDAAPDGWYHVTNRGLARRPIFESRTDIRRFLALLARSVRRGELQVHAYTVMTTHYHLLVRAEQGRLAVAMRRIQAGYALWFNRCRERDGPLFRGRYAARPVTTDAHWRAALRYIDANAIEAGLVQQSTRYPHGSAAHYSRSHGPPWLHRAVVEEQVRGWLSAAEFLPAEYARAVESAVPDGALEVARRRLMPNNTRRHPGHRDPLDDLLRAAPHELRVWMVERALNADGCLSAPPLANVAEVQQALVAASELRPEWLLGAGQRQRDAWSVMTAGLLRQCCRCTLAEVAEILHVSGATVQRYAREHARLIVEDGAYGQRSADVLSRALAEGHRPGRRQTRQGLQ